MLISTGNLQPGSLQGKVAIVTGAGQGIGLEAAKSLAWLGAKVIIAEINSTTGHSAAAEITELLGPGTAVFIQTDVGLEESVNHLKMTIEDTFGPVSIVINNATITPIGSAPKVPIDQWDASYRVNLRGPALMAIAFLPGMIKRNDGVFVSVASLGEAYLTAYETFKQAQVRLSTTMNVELEGKNVSCFSINPGLVRTNRAMECIEVLAPIYGITVDEFIQRSDEMSVEAAGAGFAAAVVLANNFRGQEITSRLALKAAGINLSGVIPSRMEQLPQSIRKEAAVLCRSIITTLSQQSVQWSDRPVIEQQWAFQDFKKWSGDSVEGWLQKLDQLRGRLEANIPDHENIHLEKLSGFFGHLQSMAGGNESDPLRQEEKVRTIQYWQKEVMDLESLLSQR